MAWIVAAKADEYVGRVLRYRYILCDSRVVIARTVAQRVVQNQTVRRPYASDDLRRENRNEISCHINTSPTMNDGLDDQTHSRVL